MYLGLGDQEKKQETMNADLQVSVQSIIITAITFLYVSTSAFAPVTFAISKFIF